MPAFTWGNPSASKRALLLHGLTSSCHSWHQMATEIASRGYFVIAPDLLGHGCAKRGSDYTISAMVEDLQPYLPTPGSDDGMYDIVIGSSLGGLVVTAILPFFKSTRPVNVVLCDPPLERTSEEVAAAREHLFHPMTPEDLQRMWPAISREEALFVCLGQNLCDRDGANAILDQNQPWSFAKNLSTVPDNVKVTLLAADPSRGAISTVEQVKAYPHVLAKTVSGSGHLIVAEAPKVVLETAFEGVQ